MKKILVIVMVAVLAFGTFAGCRTSAESTNAQVETTKAEQVKAEETTEETPDEDASLVIYSAGPGGLSEALAVKFEQETGIHVELFQSTTGKILSKLEAEKANSIADVVVLASWPSAMTLKAQGMTQAYAEAKNADKLHEGFVDTDSHLFGYSASALGITYNTNLVAEPGKDWSDFADNKFQGMVNIPDPTLSGSCMDFISGYMCTFQENGWSLFEELQANGVEVGGANKAALEPVVTGAKGVVLAGVDYMAYSNKAKGEPVDIVYPASGTVVNPRAVMILKDAHNLENAQLYIDFMLSDAAQELVKEAFIIPGRADVRCDNRANMDEIPLLDYDWDVMAEQQTANIEQFSNIFGQ